MLAAKDMLDMLSTFGDPDNHPFAYPGDEGDARTKWADAFVYYLGHVTPPIPALPQLAAAHTAFHDTLRFTPLLVGMNPLTDFAAAWNAAMVATAVPWDPILAARTTQLRTTLSALFATPALGAQQRLGDIANAFHAATYLMTAGGATVTYQ